MEKDLNKEKEVLNAIINLIQEYCKEQEKNRLGGAQIKKVLDRIKKRGGYGKKEKI